MKLPKLIHKRKLKLSEKIYNFFATINGLTVFVLNYFKYVLYPPYEFNETRKHMHELGVKTFPIVSLTGFIIGLVLAMQTQPVLQKFGATDVLPAMVALSVFRELGPVLRL